MNAPLLDLSYTRLPQKLYSAVYPQQVTNPKRLLLNRQLAGLLGMDHTWLESEAALQLFCGQTGDDRPAIAMAYSGHQFVHLSPLLGDGRAALVGEIVSPAGVRYDLHLKGTGPTPYSRRGDGLSTLRAALKEYVFSESFAALGIPCSRSLAVVTTGMQVMREQAHPGAILTRAARCHVRVGTFQFAALQQDTGMLRSLADFVIHREFPELDDNGEAPYLRLFEKIVERQAVLVATWMASGFIHGVMNTDNMAVSGETIDFGPCAFMDYFNPGRVFSSIDEYGRYAWNRQADIAVWNLSRLAEAMLPLLAADTKTAVAMAEKALEKFPDLFNAKFNRLLAEKLGLVNPDTELLKSLLAVLAQTSVDYTLFFRRLAKVAEGENQDVVLSLSEEREPLVLWLNEWEQALPRHTDRQQLADRMNRVNPMYIPRIWLLEQAFSAANNGNMQPFETMLRAVQNPFFEANEFKGLEQPPSRGQSTHATFCET